MESSRSRCVHFTMHWDPSVAFSFQGFRCGWSDFEYAWGGCWVWNFCGCEVDQKRGADPKTWLPGCLSARLPVNPVARFRHRSLFILFSRPCIAALIERFLSGRTHFSYFSVQKHWKQKFSSMRDSIFPEILFLEGRECAQSKLLYRILGNPGRNSNKTSYLFPVLWTLFFLKWPSVPKTFLGTGWQLTLLNLDKFGLNKIAARWPARAVAQFYFAIKKSSGKTLRNSVLLSYHTKQLNTESPTAYEKNSTFRRLPQSELWCQRTSW